MAKLILLQHTEHKVGFFREKNKRILSNKSAQGRIFLEKLNALQSYQMESFDFLTYSLSRFNWKI